MHISSSLNTFKTNSLLRYTSVLIPSRQILHISVKSHYMIRIMIKKRVQISLKIYNEIHDSLILRGVMNITYVPNYDTFLFTEKTDK